MSTCTSNSCNITINPSTDSANINNTSSGANGGHLLYHHQLSTILPAIIRVILFKIT